MNQIDNETTSESVPIGKYVKRDYSESDTKDTEDTREHISVADRRLKIQTDERTSTSSFSFIINIEKEKELTLFRQINRRLRELKK